MGLFSLLTESVQGFRGGGRGVGVGGGGGGSDVPLISCFRLFADFFSPVCAVVNCFAPLWGGGGGGVRIFHKFTLSLH